MGRATACRLIAHRLMSANVAQRQQRQHRHSMALERSRPITTTITGGHCDTGGAGRNMCKTFQGTRRHLASLRPLVGPTRLANLSLLFSQLSIRRHASSIGHCQRHQAHCGSLIGSSGPKRELSALHSRLQLPLQTDALRTVDTKRPESSQPARLVADGSRTCGRFGRMFAGNKRPPRLPPPRRA